MICEECGKPVEIGYLGVKKNGCRIFEIYCSDYRCTAEKLKVVEE